LPNFTIHRLISKEGDLKYDKKEELESNDWIFLIIKTCQLYRSELTWINLSNFN
jgi:hypothetical protein